MISAKDNLVSVKADLVCNFIDKIPKIRRLHSGITAKLIDLICCCFYQDTIVKPYCLFQAGFNHKPVCRTERRNPCITHSGLSVFQHSS